MARPAQRPVRPDLRLAWVLDPARARSRVVDELCAQTGISGRVDVVVGVVTDEPDGGEGSHETLRTARDG